MNGVITSNTQLLQIVLTITVIVLIKIVVIITQLTQCPDKRWINNFEMFISIWSDVCFVVCLCVNLKYYGNSKYVRIVA